MDHNETTNFTWRVADQVRNEPKRGKCQDIIPLLAVLSRCNRSLPLSPRR